MTNKINYSQNENISAGVIEDLIPEKLIRVYPYEMVNASRSEEFVGAQTTSIVSINQANLGIDEEGVDNEELLKDQNGDKYFEMFASITSTGKLDYSTATSTLGQELKEEDSFLALSNWYYEGELEDIKLGSSRLVPAIFTIGKAFDYTSYVNDEQAVFVATSMVEAKEGQMQYSDTQIDVEGLYEISLTNISVLESSFTNSRILFNLDTSNLNNPKIDYNGKTFSGFQIKPDSRMLISSIRAKGKTEYDDDLTDINLVVKEGLVPMKATPISTQDKVTLFMDWFDYDVVMPQYIANVFQDTAGKALSDLKNIDFEKNGVTVNFFDDAQLELIQDVILASSLYAESFSKQEWRYTADEAKNAGGGAKAGDIKGSLSVGSKKQSMSAMASKDPIKFVDGIFETYLRYYPEAEDSTQYLAIKEIFAAASRYIYSTYSIGKGQNSFNQVYLPWFLRPLTAVEFSTDANNNITLSDQTKWRLESQWFNFENRQFEIDGDTEISKIKLIKTDRKLTIPELPYTVDAITKLPLPGDINTKSSQDLKYMWHLPFADRADISKLYLGQARSSTSANPTVKFNTGWTNYGESTGPIADFIRKQYAAINGIAESKVHYKSEGVREERINRENSTHNDGFNLAQYKSGNIWVISIMNADENLNFIGVGAIPATEENYKKWLAEQIAEAWRKNGKTWMTADMVRIVDGKGFTTTPDNLGRGDFAKYDDSFGVEFVSERYVDAQVVLDQAVTTYDVDRETLFDKSSWNRYLVDNNFVLLPELTLVSDDSISISYIDEIIISSIWGENIEIIINGSHHVIEMFNETDETIGTQRIIFT